MPKKKRQSAEFKRRSKAAKKGWETRKRRILPKKIRKEETLVNNAKKVKGKKPNPRIETKGKTAKQLEKMLIKERKAREEAERRLNEEVATVGFVDARNPEFLHRDMTLAVHPCRLRHRPEAPDLRKALKDARKKGLIHLGQLAHDIADFYDLPIREVYTLYWSP